MINLSLLDDGTIIIHADDDDNPDDNGVILYRTKPARNGLDSELREAFDFYIKAVSKSYKHRWKM